MKITSVETLRLPEHPDLVWVRLHTSEKMTVQLPRGEAEALGLKEGDRVLVDMGDAKVFLEDYSI